MAMAAVEAAEEEGGGARVAAGSGSRLSAEHAAPSAVSASTGAPAAVSARGSPQPAERSSSTQSPWPLLSATSKGDSPFFVVTRGSALPGLGLGLGLGIGIGIGLGLGLGVGLGSGLGLGLRHEWVRLALEQRLHHLQVPERGGGVQGRPAFAVGAIDARTRGDEHLDSAGLVQLRREE